MNLQSNNETLLNEPEFAEHSNFDVYSEFVFITIIC